MRSLCRNDLIASLFRAEKFSAVGKIRYQPEKSPLSRKQEKTKEGNCRRKFSF
jgi:hypothetical protein